MKQGLYQPKALINIKRIPELKGLSFDASEGLTIGALVTHRELETSALVREKFPVLCEAEREVANIRVRNMGTVGGNLASGEPLTDLSQIFIALDATLKISGPNGQRNLPVEQLFIDFYTTSLAEEEIITQVVVPPLPRNPPSSTSLLQQLGIDKPRRCGCTADIGPRSRPSCAHRAWLCWPDTRARAHGRSVAHGSENNTGIGR